MPSSLITSNISSTGATGALGDVGAVAPVGSVGCGVGGGSGLSLPSPHLFNNAAKPSAASPAKAHFPPLLLKKFPILLKKPFFGVFVLPELPLVVLPSGVIAAAPPVWVPPEVLPVAVPVAPALPVEIGVIGGFGAFGF